MPSVHEVIEENNAATDFVVGTPGQIDNVTAELVLRSSAVAADTLTPHQVTELGKPALNALLDAANAAQEVAPLDPADKQRIPRETDAEYRHRTEVWQPLHRLQSVVSLGEYGNNPEAVSKVKRAVWLSSTAFERILTDPAAQQFSELQRTVGYFGGNTRAAAGRAKRLRTPDN